MVEGVLNGLLTFDLLDGATTFYLNQVTVFVKTNLLVVLKSRILS